MKFFSKIFMFIIAVSIASHAQSSGFSGKVVLVSDYIFRGISLTGNEPGIQGGFQYNHDSGFYGGIFAKSVDFENPTVDTSIEIDNYIGYQFKAGPLNFDMRAIYFAFPETSRFNFPEFYFAVGYPTEHVTYHAFAIYSAAFLDDKNNDALYLNAGGTVHLPKEFNLRLAVGHQHFKKTESYFDYYVGLSKEMFGLEFTGAYTDVSDIDLNDDTHTFVFSVAKSF